MIRPHADTIRSCLPGLRPTISPFGFVATNWQASQALEKRCTTGMLLALTVVEKRPPPFGFIAE